MVPRALIINHNLEPDFYIILSENEDDNLQAVVKYLLEKFIHRLGYRPKPTYIFRQYLLFSKRKTSIFLVDQ